MTVSGDIIIQNGDGQWLKFSHPHRFYFASELSEIPSLLESVDSEISSGACVAGFLSYEASPAIDPAFQTNHPDSLPLAWFGVYDKPQTLDSLPLPEEIVPNLNWESSITDSEYSALIERIKEYISAGDTYQVNFTVKLQSLYSGIPYALFHRLQESQQSNNSAYIETDDFAICSASPELFFEISGDSIRMRPMKGTARRGSSFNDDQKRILELKESDKNRAENVMIVDMIRNDLGRVADPGTVHVTSLFDVERYPTVLQMTSTVEAVTHKPFSDVMRALFPCSSITGAPKVRTMQIISELESNPRGVYTGSIGYWLPEREARFNVAIRTAVIDKTKAEATYGVGGGIVWDSVDSLELDECFAKADILNAQVKSFDILETLLWSSQNGVYLLDKHIERAANSALYFGYKLDEGNLRRELDAAVARLSLDLDNAANERLIRCLIGRRGQVVIEVKSLIPMNEVRRVGLIPNSCNSSDKFLYHKTTNRTVYDAAKNKASDCDDVLLMNERGEITESTIANVVIQNGDEYITPPISSGLLGGTFRSELISQGKIREGVISEDLLRKADKVWMINSVRKWMAVELVY